MNSLFYEEISVLNDIPIIAWGAGYYYKLLNVYLKSVGVKYIYDQKWKNTTINEFDGLKVISDQEIRDSRKKIIIICIIDIDVAIELKNRLEKELNNVSIYLLRDLSPIGRTLCKDEILHNSNNGVYTDHLGNRIEYTTGNSLDNIGIRFDGKNALIKLGQDLKIVNKLIIECGNHTKVIIGNKSSFDNTIIYSSYADVMIGEDCMFSYDVMLRNHDSHFIFDKETGKRINYNKDIIIRDHVWIGQGSVLLSGFRIGNGSVVGANSVSSSEFPDNVIIAGNSARIIRRDIIWHRNMTWVENYDSICEIE